MIKFDEIVLFGMPNSGKSTIFNSLTKSNVKVGNWHGVTTSVHEGQLKLLTQKIKVCDLPGTYSLTPVTLEESVATKKVLDTKGLIVCVIEAVTLPLAIQLVNKLLQKNKKVLVAVNMVKELFKRGGKIDINAFVKNFPAPVIFGEFNTKKGIQLLISEIENYSKKISNEKSKNFLSAPFNIDKYFSPPTFNRSILDKITMGKFTGIITLVFCFLAVFYMAFGRYGIGVTLSDWCKRLFVNLSNGVVTTLENYKVSPFAVALVKEGVFEGILGIISFLPQTITLAFFMSILELSGYMSRVAVILDGAFKNTGLNGRVIFSTLMGLGCTAVAVSATNGLENHRARKKATLLSAYVPCSAKIPVFSIIACSAVIGNSFVYILSLYALGILLAVLQAYLAQNLFIKGERVPLVMEVPPYRAPRVNDLVKFTFKTFKSFIVKICTVIFLISCALFLLKSVSINFTYVKSGYENTFLYYLGEIFKWLFYPLNIDDWRLGVLIVSGIFAKEGIATSLIALYPYGLPFSWLEIFCISLFIYAYTPCITALSVIKAEFGFKFTLKFSFLQLLEAFIICSGFYYLVKYPYILGLFLLLFIINKIIYKKRCGKAKKRI